VEVNVSVRKKQLLITVLTFYIAIVDCKPPNMNELNEVITSAEFHPLEPHSFIHSSSKGVVKMADMRSQALCDRTVKSKLCCQ
jgi:hypothetical protein